MRTHVILLTLGAAFLAACTGQAAPAKEAPKQPELSKAEQLFQDGRDALLSGDYTKAANLLEKAVAADKTKTAYRLYLARPPPTTSRPDNCWRRCTPSGRAGRTSRPCWSRC